MVIESDMTLKEYDKQHYVISKALYKRLLDRIVYLEKELKLCREKEDK